MRSRPWSLPGSTTPSTMRFKSSHSSRSAFQSSSSRMVGTRRHSRTSWASYRYVNYVWRCLLGMLVWVVHGFQTDCSFVPFTAHQSSTQMNRSMSNPFQTFQSHANCDARWHPKFESLVWSLTWPGSFVGTPLVRVRSRC